MKSFSLSALSVFLSYSLAWGQVPLPTEPVTTIKSCKTDDGKPGKLIGGVCIGNKTAGGTTGETNGGTPAEEPNPDMFPKCPFQMDFSELIPSDIQKRYEELAKSVAAKGAKDANCRKAGEELTNLLNLLKPKKTDSKTDEDEDKPDPLTTGSALGGMGGGGSGGGSLGGGGKKPKDFSQFMSSAAAPQTEGCSANPARCDELIAAIIRGIQDGTTKSCYTSAEGGLSTILGIAFKVGTSIGTPIVGQIALGVSTIQSIIGLFKGMKKDPMKEIDKFFNKTLLEAKMNTLNACYADKLYQDANCRQSYMDCMLGSTDELADQGMCNFGMVFDVNLKPELAQQSPTGSKGNDPCVNYQNRKPTITKIQNSNGEAAELEEVLLECLQQKAENPKLVEKDFLIDTHVMGDVYACVSYWTNIKKGKGESISGEELAKIRGGCLKGKKTRGGAAINGLTFDFNNRLFKKNNVATQEVKDLLQNVMKEAQEYHQAQVKEISREDFLQSDDGATLKAVNHCFYGYGTDLAMNKVIPKGENKTYNYTDDKNSLPAQCQSLSQCAARVFKANAGKIELPKDGYFYDITPSQSLESMFLFDEKTKKEKTGFLGLGGKVTKYISDTPRICYGIAMNKIYDHQFLSKELRKIDFDGESCGEAKKVPTDRPDLNYSPSVQQ